MYAQGALALVEVPFWGLHAGPLDQPDEVAGGQDPGRRRDSSPRPLRKA